MRYKLCIIAIILALASVFASACAGGTNPTPTPSSSPAPTAAYSQYQLEYQLLAKYTDFFWCDPDFYPIAREGIEEQNSQAQFPDIRANEAEFSAILEQLGLPDKADYTSEEKLNIYREHKKLTRIIQMTPSGVNYTYVLRTGEGQGFRIEGTVTPSGSIKETKKETSFNTCPICLTRGTLIDTPDGPVPVEMLLEDMLVWTMDEHGNGVSAAVTATSSTPVPPSFQVVRIILDDGRAVTASPNHPSATGQALDSYQPGDILDGSVITSVERVNYDGGATHDILPSGTTGLYRANGILLKSTIN